MRFLYGMFFVISCCACTLAEKDSNQADMKYPPTAIKIHGEIHTDPYGWLRVPSETGISADKLALIEKENAKTNDFFAENDVLTQDVFEQIKSLSEKGRSFPDVATSEYVISKTIPESTQYPLYKISYNKTGEAFTLLDGNERGKGQSHYEINSFYMSPSNELIGWSEDTNGSENYSLLVKNVKNEQILVNIPNTSGEFVWGADDDVIYYIKRSEDGFANEIRKRYLTTNKDTSVYLEEDNTRWLMLSKSVSGKFVFMYSSTHDFDEVYAIELGEPEKEMRLIVSHEMAMSFSINHIGELFYIRHSDKNDAYSISTFNGENISLDAWTAIYTSPTAQIVSARFFKDYVAFYEREEAMDRLKYLDLNTKVVSDIPLKVDIYAMSFGRHYQNVDQQKLRFSYQGLLVPRSVMEYDLVNKNLTKVSKSTIEFDASKYLAKVIYAKSHDNIDIPISIISLKEVDEKGAPRPSYIYSYGAYGDGMGPEFPDYFFGLIDRGFVYSVAHLRGGDEKGQAWRDGGRLLNKANTGKDLISVAEALIEKGYTTAGNISLSGESAAGIPIGYAINNRPELFKSVTLLVPFVDVLNSLMDESLSINVTDWTEFGNPLESKEVFDYVKAYAPYENITKQAYPHIYVTGSQDDNAVGYWEPLKFIFRLRDYSTSDSLSLVYIRKGGHKTTALFSNEYEFAKQVSFMLRTHGIEE